MQLKSLYGFLLFIIAGRDRDGIGGFRDKCNRSKRKRNSFETLTRKRKTEEKKAIVYRRKESHCILSKP